MRRILLGLTFFFFCSSSAFAADFYVKSGGKYYRVYKLADGTPSFSEILLVDMDGGEGFPEPPPGPSDPPANPTDPQAKQDAFALAQKMGSKRDAAVLAAIYQQFGELLVSGQMDVAGFKVGFTLGRTVGLAGAEKEWAGQFSALDSKYNGEQLAGNLAKNMLNIAAGFAQYSDGGEATAADILQSKSKAVDPATIIAIIKAIIELLKALNIIKNVGFNG